MRETWYVLDDNSVVHPNEVDHSDMTHKNGKVAMRGDVPSTRGVDVDEDGERVFDGPHDHLHKDWVTESERDGEIKRTPPTFEEELLAKTVKELVALATEKKIDLGEATKKADIVTALVEALEPDAAGGGYKTRVMQAK